MTSFIFNYITIGLMITFALSIKILNTVVRTAPKKRTGKQTFALYTLTILITIVAWPMVLWAMLFDRGFYE